MARRWAILILALFAVQVGGIRPAAAHSVLLSSSPADGQVLASAPARIELRFSEAVDPGATVLTLVDGSGRQWRPVSVKLTGEATLVAALPPIARETYRLTWRTVSKDDRHETSGVLVFGVGTASPRHGPLPADPTPAWREVVVRWLLLVTTGGLIGGLLLDGLGRRRALASAVAGLRPLTSGIAVLSGAVAALAAPALFALQGGSARSSAQLLLGPFGAWTVARECAIVLLTVIAWWTRRREPTQRSDVVAAFGAVVIAWSSAELGHTATSPARTLLGTLHLLAAYAWFGLLWVVGLAIIVAIRRREQRARLHSSAPAILLAFGGLAMASVATLIVTGVLLTGDSASTVDSLLTSAFGRLLLLKLGLAAAAGLLGWHTHRRLRREGPRLRLRFVAVESAVVAVVLLAAAALSSAAPPQGLRFVPGSTISGSETVSGEADGMLEAVTIGPNRPGHNFVTADVYNSRRPAPAPIDAVILRLAGPSGETIGLAAHPEVSGKWTAGTDAIGQPGNWTITVTVRRRGLPETTASYPWRVGGTVGGPARRIVSTAAAAPLAGAVAIVLLICFALALAIALQRRLRRRHHDIAVGEAVTGPVPTLRRDLVDAPR